MNLMLLSIGLKWQTKKVQLPVQPDKMIKYAFDCLVSRFDQLTIVEPRTFEELTELYFQLRNILCELKELLRIIGTVNSYSED